MSLLLDKLAEVAPHVADAIGAKIELLDSGMADFSGYNFVGLTNVYLLASYCYYELDCPVMDDGTFDALCKYLHTNFELLELCDVWHVGTVIVEENLAAGTCLGVDYPTTIRLAGGILAARTVGADDE